jgi:hypothetical protein
MNKQIDNKGKNKEKKSDLKVSDNGRKRLRLVLILVAVLLLGIFGTIMIYYNYYILDYKVVDTYVKVISPGVGGFNTDKDALRFGSVPVGSSGERYFIFHTNEDAVVKIVPSGDMVRFFSLSDYNFFLAKDDTKQIVADINIPEGTALGNYSGEINIYFFRPLGRHS